MNLTRDLLQVLSQEYMLPPYGANDHVLYVIDEAGDFALRYRGYVRFGVKLPTASGRPQRIKTSWGSDRKPEPSRWRLGLPNGPRVATRRRSRISASIPSRTKVLFTELPVQNSGAIFALTPFQSCNLGHVL